MIEHPACWVRADGCVGTGDHQQRPVPMAFGTSGPVPPASDVTMDPATAAAAARREPPPRVTRGPEVPAAGPEAARWSRPPAVNPIQPASQPSTIPTVPPDRPAPTVDTRGDGAGGSAGKPLPKLYGQHRWLQYWYVPAAVLVAVGVAAGVVGLVELLTGDDGPARPPVTIATSTPAGTPRPTVATTATTTTTPAAGTQASGRFKAGDSVLVQGAGDCLNIRSAPGRSAQIVTCVTDGTRLSIQGGPETADGLTWWKVSGDPGEGWAAEDFLSK